METKLAKSSILFCCFIIVPLSIKSNKNNILRENVTLGVT